MKKIIILCVVFFVLAILFFVGTSSRYDWAFPPRITSCPLDKPLMDYEGKCYSCDETEPVFVGGRYVQRGIILVGVSNEDGAKNCEICPNRTIHHGSCYLVAQSCSDEKPLKGIGEKPECYACDDPRALAVSNCQQCDNRRKMSDLCVLKECPEQFPLRLRRIGGDFTQEGACESCDTLRGVLADNCYVCPNRSSPWCQLKECPREAPLRDIFGGCHSCDETESIEVEKMQNCVDACPGKREAREVCHGVRDGWCEHDCSCKVLCELKK